MRHRQKKKKEKVVDRKPINQYYATGQTVAVHFLTGQDLTKRDWRKYWLATFKCTSSDIAFPLSLQLLPVQVVHIIQFHATTHSTLVKLIKIKFS